MANSMQKTDPRACDSIIGNRVLRFSTPNFTVEKGLLVVVSASVAKGSSNVGGKFRLVHLPLQPGV
jgi:hypothetical protein